jgi:hypothetical protein
MEHLESVGKFSDHRTRIGGILEDFVSTLLPDFIVAQLQAKLGTMKEAAYFRPKSGRATRNTQQNPVNPAEFEYIHIRLLIIPGKNS